MNIKNYKRWTFISDVHLNYKIPHRIKIFNDFLEKLKGQTDVLFILGDLFDFWIEHKKVKLSKFYEKYELNFKDLDYDIYFLPGNRDFDIGNDFIKLTGINIIDEEYFLINIDEKKVLLTHGDLLCRKDIRYQLFRKFIRNKYVKNIIKFFPTFFVLKFISTIENISKIEKSIKHRLTQNYNLNFTEVLMKKYNADYLVAGHLHEWFIKKYKDKTIASCGRWTLDKIEFIIYNDNTFKKESEYLKL